MALSPTTTRGGGPVLSATATLTDAQIKALQQAPFTLLASPGAGKAIYPLAAYLSSHFAAGAYTGIAANTTFPTLQVGQNLVSLIDDPDAGNQLTDFLGTTAAQVVELPVNQSITSQGGLHALASIQTTISVADTAVQITAINNGNNFTGGNAANTLVVLVLYAVFTV